MLYNILGPQYIFPQPLNMGFWIWVFLQYEITLGLPLLFKSKNGLIYGEIIVLAAMAIHALRTSCCLLLASRAFLPSAARFFLLCNQSLIACSDGKSSSCTGKWCFASLEEAEKNIKLYAITFWIACTAIKPVWKNKTSPIVKAWRLGR